MSVLALLKSCNPYEFKYCVDCDYYVVEKEGKYYCTECKTINEKCIIRNDILVKLNKWIVVKDNIDEKCVKKDVQKS
jgi:hypothetical protein